VELVIVYNRPRYQEEVVVFYWLLLFHGISQSRLLLANNQSGTTVELRESLIAGSVKQGHVVLTCYRVMAAI